MTLADLQSAFEADQGCRQGKLNSFPTEDGLWAQPEADPVLTERPLLIDPTRDDPDDFLAWRLDGEIPIVVPRPDAVGSAGLRGQTSIEVYGLNRFGLVQSRLRIMRLMTSISRSIDAFLHEIDSLDEVHRRRQLDRTNELLQLLEQFTEPGSPHISMALAYVDHMRSSLQRKISQ
jgi:hypothetical protein